MWIDLKAAARAGLNISMDEKTLHINGTEKVPERVIHSIDQIAERLAFSARDRDCLLEHVMDVSVWRALKRLTTD